MSDAFPFAAPIRGRRRAAGRICLRGTIAAHDHRGGKKGKRESKQFSHWYVLKAYAPRSNRYLSPQYFRISIFRFPRQTRRLKISRKRPEAVMTEIQNGL
ncbi:hypothetical protein [Sphingobium sp. B11D3D]|uniref:hypothetical protein n=1 Tax=Sphingobium sp. B11D3D TaxID=2940576 RepID=UPI002224DF6A|nr:hypothetical protein [Sphingobium sp. B11D3D]MCW2370177.1 hypothetical protein [Sphingobium sp. B11D3D]